MYRINCKCLNPYIQSAICVFDNLKNEIQNFDTGVSRLYYIWKINHEIIHARKVSLKMKRKLKKLQIFILSQYWVLNFNAKTFGIKHKVSSLKFHIPYSTFEKKKKKTKNEKRNAMINWSKRLRNLTNN